MKKLIGIFMCLLLLAVLPDTLGNLKPRPLSTDQRMKVIAYDPNNVVTVTGSQLIETTFEFSEGETIIGVYGGDSAAWTVNINKNRPNFLLVKPTVDSSDANLLVMTDKHAYQFHLLVSPKETASDKDVTYSVRFTYPDDELKIWETQMQAKQQLRDSLVTERSVNPLNVNWEYSFSSKCAKDFVPIKAFDDGKFTYFQFPRNTEIPAIFVVDQQGKESLANWRMRGQYVVIERIARQFSLRNGTVASCVFNDRYSR